MSNAAAWMPLFIGDYLADTSHLTTVQHGAYVLLLMHQWRTGPLADDDAQLASISKVDLVTWRKSIGPIVRKFFEATAEGLSQKRLAKERVSAENHSKKRVDAGKLGAAKRWGEDSNATGNANGNGTAIAQHCGRPSPSPRKKEPPLAPLPLEASPPAAPPKQRASLEAKGQRLPDDWNPGAGGGTFARELGLDPAPLFAKFRDYWTAKPGEKGRKSDWQATWRNWCRAEADRNPPRGAQARMSGGF